MKRTRRAGQSKTRVPATGKSTVGRRARSSQIPAGEFKARCLSLMEQVKETGREFVITKRGQPVAKLGPVDDTGRRPFVGRSRGVIAATRDALMAPVNPDWDVDADL